MPRQRRKNPRPQKVFSDETDDTTEESEKPVLELPTDPDLLIEYYKNVPITTLYEFHKLPPSILDQVEKKNNGEIDIMVCDLCEKEFISAPGLMQHYLNTCYLKKPTRFKCLICDFHFTLEEEVKEHIKLEHMKKKLEEATPSKRTRNKKTTQSFARDEENDNEEESEKDEKWMKEEYVPDIIDEEIVREYINENTKVKNPNKPRGIVAKTLDAGYLNYPMPAMMHWQYKYLKVFEKASTDFLLDLPPNLDKYKACVDIQEFEKCIRRFTKSISFSVQREKAKKVVKPESLAPFRCSQPCKQSLQRGDMTFYVGDTVRAMDWCPHTLKKAYSDQYLAIATHSNLHFFSTTYAEKGIIQLWNCGQLLLNKHNDKLPNLAFGLHHEYGPMWELKWSNCGYSKDTGPPRLGLLACASAAGVVAIFSVPLPDNLNLGDYTEDNQQSYDAVGKRIFSVHPDMLLVPSPHSLQRRKIYGQCMKVDWNKNANDHWVAGGFSSGFVALWKIVNPSKLLVTSNEDCMEIVACRVFRAHSKPVRGLAWCPFDKDVIATAGYDRFFKVWNINHPESPQMDNSNFNASTHTDMVWPTHWCGAYVATDEVFSIKHYRGVIYYDAYVDNCTENVVIPFKSPTWCVTTSDWLNAVCSGDLMGNLMIYAATNWCKPHKLSKRCPRIFLYNTTIDSKTNPSTLIFNDTDMTNLNDMARRSCNKNAKHEMLKDHSYDKPLLSSINCVKWNPNLGSHTWIASGMHCGLVRLNCVHKLQTAAHDQIAKDLIEGESKT